MRGQGIWVKLLVDAGDSGKVTTSVTGRTQAQRQPSVDELLVSIRQAIHERVPPGGQTAQGRTATAPSAGTAVTTGRAGFAGLLGGEVRLEEALARLSQAGGQQRDHPPPGPTAPGPTCRERPAVPRPDGARLRPALDASAGGATAPVPSHRPRELLSPPAASAATSAFGRLADAVSSRTPADERKLEETARDMLRPMLKEWLDQNLPRLVERLVREEIERVARTGR